MSLLTCIKVPIFVNHAIIRNHYWFNFESTLIHGTLAHRLYRDNHPLKSITHYAAPGRVPYQQAVKGKFTKTETGQSFGPT